MNISQKLHFPENLFSKIYTYLNLHLVEITFPRKLIFQIYICQNLHLAETTFLQKLIFQNLHL